MAVDLERVVRIGIDARQAESGAHKVEEAFNRVGRSSTQVGADLSHFSDQQDKVTQSSNKLELAVKSLAASVSGLLIARQVLRDIVEFEKGLVGVGKTADLSGAALDSMGQSFIDLSLKIPASTKDLLAIGQSAGQLGVKGSENILKFSKTVAQLASASDLVGDEGATALARILNVSGESTSEVDRLGSVIVRLGNNVAATESQIAHITTQVTQATAIYKIGSTAAAGFAATLAELGVRAELSGSSLGRVFRVLDDAVRNGGESMQIVEALTGRSGTEFRGIFGEDPTAGVQEFLRGLGEFTEAGGDTVKVLESLGLSGEEVLKVVPTLAVNYERLAKNIAMARDEAVTMTALEQEAARAAETVGSELTILENTMRALRLQFLGSKGPIREFVRSMSDGIRVVGGFDELGRPVTESGNQMATAMQLVGVAIAVGAVPAVVSIAAKLPGLAKQLTLTGAAATGLSTGAIAAAAALTALAAFDLGGFLYENNEDVRSFGDDLAAGVLQATSEIEYYWDVLIANLGESWDTFVAGLISGTASTIQNSRLFQLLPGAAQGVIAGAGAVATGMSGSFDFEGAMATANANRASRDQQIAQGLLGSNEDRERTFSGEGRKDAVSYLDGFGETLERELFGPLRESIMGQSSGLSSSMDEIGGSADQTQVAVDGLNSSFDEMNNLLGKTATEANKAAQATRDYFAALEFERELVFLSGDQRERAISLRELENNLIQMSVAELESVKNQLNSGIDLSAVAGDPAKLELVNEILGKADEKLKSLQQAKELEAMFDNIGNAGANAFTNWVTGVESLSDALTGLYRQIVQIAANQFIGSFISGMLGNFSGLFGGGLGSGYGAGGMGPPAPSYNGNIFSGGRITPYANGGMIDSMAVFPTKDGGIASVGERGQEVFAYPHRLSNGRLGFEIDGAGGGSTQINNFNMVMGREEQFGLTQRQTMNAFNPVIKRLRG